MLAGADAQVADGAGVGRDQLALLEAGAGQAAGGAQAGQRLAGGLVARVQEDAHQLQLELVVEAGNLLALGVGDEAHQHLPGPHARAGRHVDGEHQPAGGAGEIEAALGPHHRRSVGVFAGLGHHDVGHADGRDRDQEAVGAKVPAGDSASGAPAWAPVLQGLQGVAAEQTGGGVRRRIGHRRSAGGAWGRGRRAGGGVDPGHQAGGEAGGAAGRVDRVAAA